MSPANSKLPEEPLRHLLAYIGLIRDHLRMQNWDIILHREPIAEADTHAETWQNHNHYTTNLRISKDLIASTPGRVRNTIVHELIHAQHRDVSVLWEACTTLNSTIPEGESASWNRDFQMHMERFVSWTTQQVEKELPLYDRAASYALGDGCWLEGEQPH